jgi:GT2 family glycosyltransferase
VTEQHPAPDTPVDCTVVVVTYNSAGHIDRLLDSLPAAAGTATIRTVVVDNGSSDDTVDRVRARDRTTCIDGLGNLGYAGGINVGRKAAGPTRSILILNPDVRVVPGAIERLLDAASAPGVGMAIPRLVDQDGGTLLSLRRDPTLLRAVGDALAGDHLPARPPALALCVHDPAQYERQGPIDWATGAALLVTDECDRTVGDWDERYFMYSEEVDICARARAAGFLVEFVPDAHVVHYERGSGRTPDLDALMVLNQVRYYRTHHGRLATAVFRCVLALHEASRIWNPTRRRSARVVLGWDPPPQFPGAGPIDPVPW